MKPIYRTIISVAQLQELLPAEDRFTSKNLLIFDCSFDLMNPSAGRAAYEAAHLPGAFYLDLDHDLSDKSDAQDKASGGRHPLPALQKWAAWVGAAGVTPDTQVVVYDRNGCNFCGRAWWMLRWLGATCVAVLDGGLQAWQAAGAAVESGWRALELDFSRPNYPLPGKETALAAIDSVANAMRSGTHTIIDARAPARFRGEVEPFDPVAGHIPGALNRPFTNNFDARGCFKPASVLREEFEALLAGRDPSHVIHHCGSGVSAVPNLLAMDIAGYPPSLLFAGSWSEWCRQPDLPIARG